MTPGPDGPRVDGGLRAPPGAAGDARVRRWVQLPADGNRYEILHGELLVTSLPAVEHQRVAGRLASCLVVWCRVNAGWEWLALGGVLINRTTWLAPDAAAYPVPAGEPTRDWRTLLAPALVVEVLSPSTSKTDRHRKRPAYLAHGVRDVWLLDINARTIERWTSASVFPELHHGSITWAPADGAPALVIEHAELFGPPEAHSEA